MLKNLPDDWELCLLDDLMIVKDGTHITPTYVDSGVPFLRVTDIQDAEIDLSSVKYVSREEHMELTKRNKPEKGDILYSKNGTIGITRIVDWDWEFSIFVSLALLKIKNKQILNTDYIAQYLASDIAKQEIYKGSKQATVTNLHLEEIRKFRVPLPPLDEQRKIAEILSTWDEAIGLTEQLIAVMGRRKQALMQLLLTGEVRFAEFEGSEWEEVELQEVGAKEKYAIVDGPFGSNLKSDHYRLEGIPVIQSGFVTSNRWMPTEYVYVDEELFKQQIRSKAVAGDIVMAKIGAKCGTCAIVAEGHPDSIIAGNCLKISTDSNICLSHFLVSVLHYLYEKTGFAGIKTETAQPAITLANLRQIIIPLPQISEQKKITQILSAVVEEIELLLEYSESLTTQKRGLMQQLLTGQVRVQGTEL